MRVLTLARFLITVPLIALPAVSMQLRPAIAAATDGEQALRILARAKALETRCGFLSDKEHNELVHVAARAEIAVASQSSSAAAKRATAAGQAEAASIGCSPAARSDVRETLTAALAALAAAAKEQPRRAPPAPQAASSGTAKSDNILARYDRIVRAYYLERVCRSLSRSEDGRFWRGIVRLHKQAVARRGADAVAPLMRRAERRARGSACGREARAEIRLGYGETIGR